ncbi:MAG: carbon-nitrogen hydrolase [Mycolicibacterium sp.]|nr:carbon-nitrogen hydrolase [Mycolicibacterium sp.]
MPRDVGANVHRIRTLLADHPEADIAVFPELFVTGYQVDSLDELALSARGGVVSAIAEACADYGTAFVGGYLERADDGTLYDSMLLIDERGELVGNYRKTHLFGGESSLFTAGDQLRCVEIGGVVVAPLICFDVEIAEAARALARQDPDVFIVIAANMRPFHDDHLIATRARALDNRTPLIYVNRVGSEAGFDFVGGSRAVTGDGTVLCDFGSDAQSAVFELPLRAAVAVEVDYRRHLRPELYV